MDNREIINCELAYSRCFCEDEEDENLIRFHDDLLKDMYDHHYTYLKREMNEVEFRKCMSQEINKSIDSGRTYCKVLMDCKFDDSWLSPMPYKSEITRYGYYVFDISKLEDIAERKDCQVKRIDSEKMLEELLELDRAQDEERVGLDFCRRRVNRRGKVYRSDEGVDSYICYNKEEPVGNCDLFIHEGIAKIEDFAVSPDHQRKGYGTVLLKALISQALLKGVHRIYLITDEEDTAKEMYLKRGFKKIGEKTEVFFSHINKQD